MGTALGVALAGAALAFTDFHSPLRAPLTIFFLLVAPAAAIAVGLRALDPLDRTVVALIGSAAANAVVAQALLATGHWSATAAVTVIATLSALSLLAGLLLPSAAPTRTAPRAASAATSGQRVRRPGAEERTT